MHEHVEQGGGIDEVWRLARNGLTSRFHYDLRLEVHGLRLYVETLLFFEHPDNPDDPWIKVVSIHEQ